MILAYLDPGSGSALVGTLIALAGAVVFSVKSILYRLFGMDGIDKTEPPKIAIFSEGRNYWGTFRLLVEELISRKVHFSYYTLDLYDPALLIDNEYMHSKLYDKNRALSYAHLGEVEAEVLLSTTPNIGTPGYPLKRSAGVKKLVHVFHAFADVSAYHIGSLDNYDIVLTVGQHQEKYIREVELKRGLRAKRIIPIGLPYFDYLYLKMGTSVMHRGKTTILIATSWGAKGCLREYGVGFILDLARAGYKVIVRPHPQSLITESAFISQCQSQTTSFVNVVWDVSIDGTASMLDSDLLISDTSSIRFDYAFLYGKPVITLDVPREKQAEYECVNMSEIWTDIAAQRLGRVLNHDSIGDLVKIIAQVLGAPRATMDISAFRSATIMNLGKSAQAIADVLINEAKS